MLRMLTFFLLLVSSSGIAALPHLSPSDRVLVESVTNAPLIHTIRTIPLDILRACASSAPGHDFRIADPGQPFEGGDVVRDPSIPHRRLVWAAHIPSHYLIHYEFGGYTYGHSVLLIREGGQHSQAQVVWAAWGPQLKDYAALVRALRAGELTDYTEYYH